MLVRLFFVVIFCNLDVHKCVYARVIVWSRVHRTVWSRMQDWCRTSYKVYGTLQKSVCEL